MRKAADFKSLSEMKRYAIEKGNQIAKDVSEYREFLEGVNEFKELLKGALSSINNLVEEKDDGKKED